ncbi:solute carrier family 31 (copper transporter), member 1, partial [Lecanoromycetidae sp. Uapishka_2]
MDMSSSAANSTMMAMSSMMMAFFTSTTTTLYSTAWTPSSTGQYAGTCIFLILLGIMFRGLFALRALQEAKWMKAERKRQYIIGSGLNKKSDNNSKEPIPNESRMSNVPDKKVRPWRISTDVPRAIMDTLIAGVGYLLMIAVMTMNVGYFLSILGGIFLGSLTFGRYAAVSFSH